MLDGNSDALSYAPILLLSCPLIIAKRAGAQSGLLLYVLVKLTPDAASRSMFGVLAGPPWNERNGADSWSAIISRMFG